MYTLPLELLIKIRKYNKQLNKWRMLDKYFNRTTDMIFDFDKLTSVVINAQNNILDKELLDNIKIINKLDIIELAFDNKYNRTSEYFCNNNKNIYPHNYINLFKNLEEVKVFSTDFCSILMDNEFYKNIKIKKLYAYNLGNQHLSLINNVKHLYLENHYKIVLNLTGLTNLKKITIKDKSNVDWISCDDTVTIN